MVFRYGKGASHPVTPRPKVEVAPITVELEWPHPSLSPNAREFWATKANWVKYHRDLAFVRFREQPSKPLWKAARYSVKVILCKGQRQPDEDNFMAMLKPYRDGMEDAGIISNDRRLRLSGDVVFTRDKSLSESKVVLTVWEDEDA